jgi:nucleotide-binding universal stress UspA family protein
MSQYRRVLVHVNNASPVRELLGFAAGVPGAEDARLGAVYAVDSMLYAAYLSTDMSGNAAQLLMEFERSMRDKAVGTVAAAATAIGRPVEFLEGPGAAIETALTHSRLADLTVVGQWDPEHPGGNTGAFASGLIVGAGGPVLFVPNAGRFERCGRRVVLAWSDTRESARAMRDAMPILERAEAVEVLHFSPTDRHPEDSGSAAGVAAYLRSHGIAAEASVRSLADSEGEPRGPGAALSDRSVAALLLSHVADATADLVVMGGYGHSRAHEFVLGGVTREILRTMTVPVLMSH